MTEDSNILRTALVITLLQLIAWSLILAYFFEDYSAGAGAGLPDGFAIIFVVVPCMGFIFCTTFYFFKKNLPTWFRSISMLNYIGLFIVFAAIN